MFWKKLFLLFALAVFPSLGQTFPINYSRDWPAEFAAYLQEFFGALQKNSANLYPAYVSDARSVVADPRIFLKDENGNSLATGWSDANQGDAIRIGYPFDPKKRAANGQVHTLLTHEFYHLLQMVRGPDGKLYLLVPRWLAEPLADIFALKAGEMVQPVVPARSRQPHVLPVLWPFTTDLTPDLDLRYALVGASPFFDCWWTGNSYPCVYPIWAQPLLEVEKTVGSEFFPELHRILGALSFRAIEKWGTDRSIPQEWIWQALEERWPTAKVHGLPLRVFLQTQPVYNKPPEGENFWVGAWASWYEGNAVIGSGPVNPNVVGFRAVVNQSFFRADGPSDFWLNQRPLGQGKFTIEVQDESGKTICINPPECTLEVDLVKSVGGQNWVIPALKVPGKIVARDSKGRVVAQNRFWANPSPLAIDPVAEGAFFWEQFPALRLSPQKVVLTPNRPTASLQVINGNPTTSGQCRWNSLDPRMGAAVSNYNLVDLSSFEVASTGDCNEIMTVRAKPGLKTAKESWVCVMATPGVSVACAEVIFTSR